MTRRLQVAIDCQDPDRLAAFWGEVLEYRLADPPPGYVTWSDFSRRVGVDLGEAWSKVVDPEGLGPSLLFHRVPEPKVVKNRVHLDIRLAAQAPEETTARLVDAEVQRLVGLGASHVRTDDDETDYYAVMQDPEGNEFCVG
jgi:catechol 2,3-dioxygenase-like lactoylglutathione lyase family enzyme